MTSFSLENIALIPRLNLPDGIHPNAQGYKIFVENAYEEVEQFLKN